MCKFCHICLLDLMILSSKQTSSHLYWIREIADIIDSEVNVFVSETLWPCTLGCDFVYGMEKALNSDLRSLAVTDNHNFNYCQHWSSAYPVV